MESTQRSTRQRTAIRTTVEQAGRPLLAPEILERAQAEVPGLSLATVYRNLKSLVEAGELQVVQLPGENPRYEMHHGHHHHFLCRHCQRVFDIDACPGNLARLVPQGFSLEDHELTLYGRCPDCQNVGR